MRKAVAVLLGASVVMTLALVSHAPQTGGQPKQEPAAGEQGDGEAVRGTLRYETESGEDAFAEGVDITVETADGQEVDTVTSDEDGEWEVALPGPGRYTVTIDPDTLPEGVSLQDEDRTTLTFEMGAGRARTVLFALTAGFGGPRAWPRVTSASCGSPSRASASAWCSGWRPSASRSSSAPPGW